MEGDGPTDVTVDTDVLLEFIRTQRLDLLGRNPAYRFIVPDNVYVEIEEPSQKERLDQAIDRDFFPRARLVQPEALDLYQKIRKRLDKGESACIALSAVNGWYVASDETGALDEVAEAYLGRRKVIRSADILLTAIKRDLLDVREADKLKTAFDKEYSFRSFGDFL